jgi:hypothetical protein
MNRVVAGLAGCAALAAAGFGAANLARGTSYQWDAVRSNDTRPYEVRFGGGAAGLDVDHGFTLAVFAFIRGDDTYAIATGPRARPSNPNTLPFMITYFVGRLQPARYVPSDQANWVLCYGCNPSDYPRFETVWGENQAYEILNRTS